MWCGLLWWLLEAELQHRQEDELDLQQEPPDHGSGILAWKMTKEQLKG